MRSLSQERDLAKRYVFKWHLKVAVLKVNICLLGTIIGIAERCHSRKTFLVASPAYRRCRYYLCHYGEYGQWVTPALYFMARLKPVRLYVSSKPLTDRLVTSWTAIHVNGDSTSNANRVVSVQWSAGTNALLSLARWLADNDSTTVTLFLLGNWLTHRGNRKYPIRHKIWHPIGSGFGRKVEIWPDLDSWIGYPSILSWKFTLQFQYCSRLRNDLYCVEWDVKL